MVQSLEKLLDDRLRELMNAGYGEVQAGHFENAEKKYLQAWDIFPEPKFDWDSSQITLYGIAEFYLRWRSFDLALHWANLVFKTEPLPGDGSPYLTLGIIYFESGDLDSAFKNFQRAFELAKRRVFQGVEKKYLEFYLSRAEKRSRR